MPVSFQGVQYSSETKLPGVNLNFLLGQFEDAAGQMSDNVLVIIYSKIETGRKPRKIADKIFLVEGAFTKIKQFEGMERKKITGAVITDLLHKYHDADEVDEIEFGKVEKKIRDRCEDSAEEVEEIITTHRVKHGKKAIMLAADTEKQMLNYLPHNNVVTE